jgi:hypothetical protein
LAIGLALLTSLVAVCCGLGIFAAPWFLCELFALQIAIGTGEPTRRTTAWFRAALIQMVAVTGTFAIAVLSLLSLGPDVVLGGMGLSVESTGEHLAKNLGMLLLVGGLVIAVSVHFEHAPAILLDRGGGMHAALLESARLVAETGPFRTWLTSIAGHGLQMAPGLAAITLAASRGSLHSSVLWGIALLPLVAMCMVLGQGMVVSSYLRLRHLVTDPARIPPEAAPSKSGAFLWSLLLAAVLSGPLLISAALAKPARLARGQLPAEASALLDLAVAGAPVERYLPDTALRVRLTPQHVSIAASDGGGVGTLPLPASQVSRVRAARAQRCDPARLRAQEEDCAPSTLDEVPLGESSGSAFVLEVTLRDGRRFVTWVDDTGVRLDDSLTERLDALLPRWAPLILVLCLAWTTVWIARALPPQARLRRELAEGHCCASELDRRDRLKAAIRRRALLTSLWLVPPALASAAVGLWAAVA